MIAPLENIHVVTLAPNVPGPVAAARLHELGAIVRKLESPGGDLLESAAPEWYARLHDGIDTTIVDLKTSVGRATLERELATADIFLTSLRTSALDRLGYPWATLHEKYPRLIHIAIVGETPGAQERPGHDLTYLVRAGLVDPTSLPRTLFADLAGAERAVSATLAALLLRAKTSAGSHTVVSLAQAAEALAEPLKAGLTGPGQVLGGGFAGYGLYPCSDGYVALAALEMHFFEQVCNTLLGTGEFETLAQAFASQPRAQWEAFAKEHDVPLATLPRNA